MPEHIVKPCPRCFAPLEIKVNRQTGEEFLGCSAWQPRGMGCNYTEPLPEAIVLRRQGQRGLFDEESTVAASTGDTIDIDREALYNAHVQSIIDWYESGDA